MKLHYKGKYNLDPESLPKSEHKQGAVQFKEAENSIKLALIANGISLVIMLPMIALAVLRAYSTFDSVVYDVCSALFWAGLATFPFLFVHELLHAVCFKKDVYLYTNWKQAMLFVVGTEDMSKGRFVFLSLLPNVVLGVIPYVIGMIFPNMFLIAVFGALMTASGAGDYYNMFNALTQMPKGARTYMHGFHSYWYIP